MMIFYAPRDSQTFKGFWLSIFLFALTFAVFLLIDSNIIHHIGFQGSSLSFGISLLIERLNGLPLIIGSQAA
jgi:hypothetical protein